MLKIETISQDPIQDIVITLETGEQVLTRLRYLPTIKRWIMNLTYGTKTINGIMLCVHPNLLKQFKSSIPFGIAIKSKFNLDPTEVDDFANGNTTFYILNATEVKQVNDYIFGIKPLPAELK